MPPKKKKLGANPIVVGTVSTRSTRRQSIVNIDIPKSTRIKRGGKSIAKRVTLVNKLISEISDEKEDAEAKNSSLEFILETSSESERTDRSERIDSPEALPKSGSNIEVRGSINRSKTGKPIAQTSAKMVYPKRKIITDITSHVKEYAKSDHSSLEFFIESSSESEKTDKSDIMDSSDTDALIKAESELPFDNGANATSRLKKEKGLAVSRKIVTNMRPCAKDNSEAEHSSLEFASDSSSESEITDRSELIDSSDTDALNKSKSDMRPEIGKKPSMSEKYSFSRVVDSETESPKAGEESKQALLQILQDWDDDEESQEQNPRMTKFLGQSVVDKSEGFENLEFGEEDMSEIIRKDVNSASTTPVIEETEELNAIQKGGSSSIEIIDEDNSIEEEVLGSCTTPIEVQYEESETQHKKPVDTEESMDVAFEDDNIVGCVIEEIVPNTTEEITITDTNIDSNASSEPQVISASDINSPMIQTEEDMSVTEVTADVASEESRSMSTMDSNDAEVGRFFSKDIQDCETIKAPNEESSSAKLEGVSNLEEQLIENEICISQDCVQEENNEDKEIEVSEGKIEIIEDLESQRTQEILNILEDDSREDKNVTSNVDSEVKVEKVHLDDKISHSSELQKERDILSILEDDSEEDQNTTAAAADKQKNVDTDSKEEKLEEIACEEQEMEDEMKRMVLEEPPSAPTVGKHEADATLSESFSVEAAVIVDDKEIVAISIENKIAKMHLDDVSVNQSHQEIVPSNIQDDLESLKAETSLNCCSKSVLSSSEEFGEKMKAKEAKRLLEKNKGSRLNVSKFQKELEELSKLPKFEKNQKQTTPSKSKDIKVKEKKMLKEPKPKKSVSTAPKKATVKSEKKEKSKTDKKERKSDIDTDDMEVRRSSRIKFINDSNSTKKIKGRGLVKSKSESSLASADYDFSDNSSVMTESGRSTPVASPKVTIAERKSRWSKSTENVSTDPQTILGTAETELAKMEIDDKPKAPAKDPVIEGRLKQFVHLKENSYKTDRMTCKEAKKMTCDCFLTAEEIGANEYGCGEDCLNRLLLIECGNLCQVGDRCTNKRFQKTQFAPVEVFNTEKKGLGLRAAANIPFGEFILEYVGEVLNSDEFDKRAEVYSQDKNIHYYFMALRADAIIDATMKGNISRFINHSCDPNAETQKWTVNGELRIGFFSTRTILAGEEVTFDYRFQRYGKEAQKCFCGASICRGWLGEEPDSDEDEDDEEDEETPGTAQGPTALPAAIKNEVPSDIKPEPEDFDKSGRLQKAKDKTSEELAMPAVSPAAKKKLSKKKPRVELFEEIDQLDEEIEMLVTTGLKNQAQTLKLSRLVVRAKDPQQRAKLLRVLRRGELPCRRLFLDYHGLRLIHGYMIDAQQLVLANKKYENMRLEMLQTLAVLPIPNKSMLQDSKVLSTVELWASDKGLASPLDSDSNSPKTERDEPTEDVKAEDTQDREEEIKFLANKLLEEWSNLKEVFKIPKKERIEQMKEHEREANKKFIQSQNAYENEQDKEKKSDRYRSLSVRYKIEKDSNRKGVKQGDKPSAEFLKLSKVERRKLFALQHELREEERRMKQREMWRQHEMNCMLMGTDPRFTAPFDPSRGFHCVWNPQIGQWQNYPSTSIYPTQTPPLSNISLPSHQIAKNYSYTPPLPMNSNVGLTLPHGAIPSALQLPSSTVLPQMPSPLVQYHETVKEEDPSLVKFMGPIPPPVKLPPKWKCARDKYGRPYYYHVKLRKSQWEPPPLAEPEENLFSSESESSSDTSSISSDSSSDNSESDVDDTKLLIEVRKQMDSSAKAATKPQPKPEETAVATLSPEDKPSEEDMDLDVHASKGQLNEDDTRRPSIDMRLKQLDLFKDEKPPIKKRRIGLCEEIIISPRTEEDKKQFKEDMKRYKANKEKLKRQKELILLQTKKQLREIELKKIKEKRPRTSLKAKIKDMPDFNSDAAKKIKETFRANMASTVVHSLNVYRKSDCTEGKITNTEDFKHLARKLTHFVMLKEMKHISTIEELTCTDSVKTKAREYIRKYMSKFGEVYVKRNDSPDFKD